MPFDPYALCPGGRDKKVRFCCPNMLKELEQVIRLLESEQTGACFAYIESLEKNHPNCACLTKAKLSIYRSENRWQEALSLSERFYADEPGNPVAAAEYTMALLFTGNPQRAVSTLVDAFERSKTDSIHSSLLHAALQTAVSLSTNRLVVPAIALGYVLKEIPATAEHANTLLFRVTAEESIPIFLRDWAFDYGCPEDFPDTDTFDEVTVLIRLLRWKQALNLLETLIPHANVWPGIWYNIAAIHLWLLDNEKACEALKTYSSLSNVSLENAADAATMRLLHIPDPLGDQIQLLSIDYVITDSEKALEKLLSDPLFFHVDTPPQFTSPPPRGCFRILDRPFAEPDTALTLENVSAQQVFAALFGKETNREARLWLQVVPVDEQDFFETKVREILGDLIQFPGTIVERMPFSKTFMLAQFHLCFSPQAEDRYAETIDKLTQEYYTSVFVEKWLALPLGLLDGKTPIEAAKEPQYTVSLEAAVQRIALWLPEELAHSVATDLRNRLGLPAQDTITIAESTVAESSGEDPLTVLDAYPIWRWHRFDVSKFSTEILAGGLQIVLGMHELRAAARFAEELLNRPMDSMPFPARIMAFEALILASQESGNFEQALLWVERGKSESASQNIPDAAWYLHEISLRLMQGNGEAANDAIRYLTTHYGDNMEVMQSLQELLVQLGLFNPDGTLSAALARVLAETGPPLENQRIWTPDGGPSSGNSAKLWVPD